MIFGTKKNLNFDP